MLGYVLFNIFARAVHQSSKPCLLGACELLAWINTTLQLSLSKVEEVSMHSHLNLLYKF